MNRYRRATWIFLFGLVAAVLVFGDRMLNWYIDWLWFGEVGQRGVFWRIIGAQAQLGLLFGIGLAALFYVNLSVAGRTPPQLTPRLREPRMRSQLERLARVGLRVAILIASLVAGFLAAAEASSHWEQFLLFRNPQSFGSQDPIFHHDIGFYLFTLPFWKYLYSWAFIALALATVATAAVYVANQAVQLADGVARVAVGVRVHLSLLLGLLALTGAWGYRISAYDLLYDVHARYFGAGYADVHARLPAINILTVCALIAAAGFFLNAFFYRALWLPGAALAFMLVASLTVGSVYPSLVQRFQVQPNEANLERPFIENHIRLTRAAFDLNRIRAQAYHLKGTSGPEVLQQEAGTLSDIRLWDYRALVPTYRQLQGLRNYYDLSRIDIDRYPIGGRRRQVMLAARELDSSRLPNPSWVIETLQFTHGYGLVMNPVNEVTENGQPQFVMGGLPLQAAQPALMPRLPQIYFGEMTTTPVVAPSKMGEFDFNLDQRTDVSRFEGGTGLPLGGWWSRALFATYLRETNLILSDQITAQSRLLIRRRIDERAARIAPFLAYDHDPYLVVGGGDRLYWIQDGYTVSSQFPYSFPFSYGRTRLRRSAGDSIDDASEGTFNYIRNSVKVVIDAYSGRMEFYVFDPADPLVRSYRTIFPGLFKDAAEMPPFLREHVRYPEDLFSIQTRALSTFHVEDPLVFFNQTSFWDIPREELEQDGRSEGGKGAMEPYYVMMRLPGETREEYVLIQPFVFRGQQNMSAWLAARCDADHLGEMRLFTFDTYVKGPELIEQAIQAKPAISEALTLLSQRGSKVVWGNLLVLPLADTLIYVRPLYLSAVTTDQHEAMRELQNVVVAQGENVIMAPSLDEALAKIFRAPGGQPAQAPPPRGPAATGPTQPQPPVPDAVRRKSAEADEALRAAQQALSRNDWTAFGQQMDRAQKAIRDLRRLTGAGN
jgi:uncharacterized membrane protein (UPF0182 family)